MQFQKDSSMRRRIVQSIKTLLIRYDNSDFPNEKLNVEITRTNEDYANVFISRFGFDFCGSKEKSRPDVAR